ncbi:MAG: lamin tail domain-containing protein, partial [Planctomycetales bacterium]|nr:lamin tail domain-containing protein [Planctomycetales bacterium]
MLLAADVMITEFMAANERTVRDSFRRYPDWIELHNQGDETASLDQYHLTDDPDNLSKWNFPAGTNLAPNEYLVVYASGLDRVAEDGELHANFQLSASGDYLALTKDFQVLSEFGQDGDDYPDQFADVSFGRSAPNNVLTSTDTPIPISSTETSTITSQIPVTASGNVTDVNVSLNIEHTWASDLDVFLIGPTGTRVELFTDVGSSGDNFVSTVIDDQADTDITAGAVPFTGSFRPEGTLADLNGPAAAGTWTLEINDDFGAQGGQLLNWSLTVETTEGGASGSYVGYLLTPTPGEPNVSEVAEIGPRITRVTKNPGAILADQDFVVTARVRDLHATVDMNTVMLTYRTMYGDSVTVLMLDDGSATSGDETANDGFFAAKIPADALQAGEMVRWYVSAADANGLTSRSPAFLDNSGEDQSPEYWGTLVTDSALDSQLPVYHWFIEPGTESRANSTRGTRSSVFYAGEFYDNVFVRIRGGSSTSLVKKSYKFDFNTAHDFRFDEDADRVTEINVNTTYTNKDYVRQALAFETYDAAGLPASEAFPMRIERNGEFFSVAMFVEQPDANLLAREGLDPDGALYKMFNTFT